MLVIFAQRMPFPVVRHHDAPQIRMIAEVHAEQIEGLPLIPVGARQTSVTESICGSPPGRRHFKRSRSFRSIRMQMIHDFEARLGRIPIYTGDRTQTHKAEIVFQKAADADDLFRRDFDSQFAPVEFAGQHSARIERF